MFTTLSERVARWHDNGAAGPRVVPGGQLKRGGERGLLSQQTLTDKKMMQTNISSNSHNWLSQSARWSYLIFRCVSILFGRTVRRRNKGGRSTKTQDFNHGGRCQIVVHLHVKKHMLLACSFGVVWHCQIVVHLHMKKHMLLACSIGVVWQPPWLKSWGI